MAEHQAAGGRVEDGRFDRIDPRPPAVLEDDVRADHQRPPGLDPPQDRPTIGEAPEPRQFARLQGAADLQPVGTRRPQCPLQREHAVARAAAAGGEDFADEADGRQRMKDEG